jgi:hypothetical protein
VEERLHSRRIISETLYNARKKVKLESTKPSPPDKGSLTPSWLRFKQLQR